MKGFWNLNECYKTNIALLDNNETLNYHQLFETCSDTYDKIKAYCSGKELAFIFCCNNINSIHYYLSCLNAGIAVLLLDAKLNEELSYILINEYKPKFIFSGEERNFINFEKIIINKDLHFYISTDKQVARVHKDLAVLLSTSGTTGSPKLVKLSYQNIQSNAESISEYLNIQQDERSVTSLPMSYSFGLSIINSYLLSGASIYLTSENIVLKNFWNDFIKFGCTSFSGVPYSYILLNKTGFEKMSIPKLHTMTQAGGRLSNVLIEYFNELSLVKNFNFYVMYGQTEATARISYVPPKMLDSKIGSIGIPIPGGILDVIDEMGRPLEPFSSGEIIYSGKNVMMGYANCQADIQRGDELNGVLKTGDLGYKDKDGYFYITGRNKRFIKISGLRINIDEIEKLIENHFNVFNACVAEDEELQILIQSGNLICASIINHLSEYYKIPKSSIVVKAIDRIPVVLSGKKDYSEIKRLFQIQVPQDAVEGIQFRNSLK